MKLDATKIILILVGLLQSLIVYIGLDIQARLNRLEFKMDVAVMAGVLDPAADFIADQDSTTEEWQEYID